MVAVLQLFESPDLTASEFCLGVGWRAKFAEERIQQTNCSLVFWMQLPVKRNVKIN
jgi:hypothetical protein